MFVDRAPRPESPRLGAMILHPTPESVSRARRWFLKFTAPYDPACSVEDCALMISELVTNAIVYGRSDDSCSSAWSGSARGPRCGSGCTTRGAR